jgi:carbon storage regulator CsrA
MLVLSRKQGESIEFPGLDVVVRVIGLKRSKVQLGIEAPRQITINRSEKAIDSDQRRSNVGDQPILDELARVEAELAALAELAGPKDRLASRRIAADSIERLEAVKRSIHLGMCGQGDVRHVSDFLRYRTHPPEHPPTESADQPVISWPAGGDDRSNCVRQGSSGYKIETPHRCAS